MSASFRTLDTAPLTHRARYQLLTSLVVPRPIGWISTRGADGVPNLAPFSYFSALSATPMLVGASIGHRRNGPKDSLVNIRARGAFCVNVVTEPQLARMNATSAEHPREVDEFEDVGLPLAEATAVDAPSVASCPAVLECRLFKEVALGEAPNTLVIGEVMAVRLAEDLPFAPGTSCVDTEQLRPVGRLWGGFYTLLGEIIDLPRP